MIGGQLVQTRDVVSETREQMRAMGAAEPSEAQWEDLLFAWRVCRHVRSNAIVIARDGATIGIGAGQMSRVDAVRLAVEKASIAQPDLLAGASLASDAFFPFADGPQLAIEAGVAAIIQPGGSVRDEEVVAAVDAAGRGDGRHGGPPLPPLGLVALRPPGYAEARGRSDARSPPTRCLCLRKRRCSSPGHLRRGPRQALRRG